MTTTANLFRDSGADIPEGAPLLELDDLVMHYGTRTGEVAAVDGVTFTLRKGEALGLVGESGCGKTSVAMSIMRLLPGNARIHRGEIRLGGTDLVKLSEAQMRRRRWKDIAMVFQGAMNSWNPVYTVSDQIWEAMTTHAAGRLSKRRARERIAELFELVGLSPAVMDRYPHEYSGGMRQRAVIAMALSCDPQLIIADEPTTALDVIVQDRILKQLKQIRHELHMSMIYISHDIAVIAEVSDHIGVMYAGKLVEYGPTPEVFRRPRHPYTWSLLTSTPSIRGPRRKLAPLGGEPPNLLAPPPACRFHPRCPLATEKCASDEPPFAPVVGEHRTACWYWDQVPETGAVEALG
jgi:peptide/nickel transport system ATP-binding protein